MVALGGPVVQAGAGGKLILASDNDGFFHQNRFYTSLMAAMGVSAENAYLGFADYPPIPGIFAGA